MFIKSVRSVTLPSTVRNGRFRGVGTLRSILQLRSVTRPSAARLWRFWGAVTLTRMFLLKRSIVSYQRTCRERRELSKASRTTAASEHCPLAKCQMPLVPPLLEQAHLICYRLFPSTHCSRSKSPAVGFLGYVFVIDYLSFVCVFSAY